MADDRMAAIRRGRCPKCWQGPIFATFWRMHESCSVCGTVYEREPGYFLMSIFMGYLLNFMIIIPVGLVWYFAELPDMPGMNADQHEAVLKAIQSAYPWMYLVFTTDLRGINIARSDGSVDWLSNPFAGF